MKVQIAAAVSVLSLLTVPVMAVAQVTEAASTTAANDLPAPDKAFVQAATMSNSTEIDASKLAMDNSFDSAVKSFARRMLVDHMKLTAAMKMATPHGDAAPVDNSDTALISQLKAVKGKDFDTLYIQKIALQGHKDAIAAFEAEIQNGQNADLKKAAEKALPTIKMHYAVAKKLASAKSVSAE